MILALVRSCFLGPRQSTLSPLTRLLHFLLVFAPRLNYCKAIENADENENFSKTVLKVETPL